MMMRPNLSSNLGRWLLGLSLAGLAVGGFLASAARAQEAAGDWHGVIAADGVEMRVGLHLEAGADGKLTGALTNPARTPNPIPLGEVTAAAGKLAFTVPATRGRYEGQWDAAKGAWIGVVSTQQGQAPLTWEKGPPK